MEELYDEVNDCFYMLQYNWFTINLREKQVKANHRYSACYKMQLRDARHQTQMHRENFIQAIGKLESTRAKKAIASTILDLIDL